MSEATLELDGTDYRILELLREDARRTVRDIAHQVKLSVAPVRRRIDRMEQHGVIVGYSVRVNQAKLRGSLEAIVELRFAGNTDIARIKALASEISEVHEVLTLAGDADAIARIRVDNVEHLRMAINRLRGGKFVIGTKTLVVLESWERS